MSIICNGSHQPFRPGVTLRHLARFATLLMVFVTGCSVDDSAPKTSLFEDDHVVASHWPNDLADVAIKLRQRLSESAPSRETLAEIEDLVSWTAEVAADTNLSEADWLPLYHASESLMANLRSSRESLSSENRAQLESLCNLVDQACTKIPAHLPNLVQGDS